MHTQSPSAYWQILPGIPRVHEGAVCPVSEVKKIIDPDGYEKSYLIDVDYNQKSGLTPEMKKSLNGKVTKLSSSILKIRPKEGGLGSGIFLYLYLSFE